jgi:hypothetical protein
MGDLVPAVVDGQRVSSVGALHELGDTWVLEVLLVRRVGDRVRDGVVLLARNDEDGSTVLRLEGLLGLAERVQLATAWKMGTPNNAETRSAARR